MTQITKKKDLRESFLMHMVEALIVAAHQHQREKKEMFSDQSSEKESVASEMKTQLLMPLTHETEFYETQQSAVQSAARLSRSGIRGFVPLFSQKPKALEKPLSRTTRLPFSYLGTGPVHLPQLPPLHEIPFGGKINLGKITPLLLDPSVISIDCPGPTKNVLVNRGGAVQTTPVVLLKKEIDDIMSEISEKTRIPLTSGLFKAAVQDLLITAVISDYVGTRFLIQKRTPFQ